MDYKRKKIFIEEITINNSDLEDEVDANRPFSPLSSSSGSSLEDQLFKKMWKLTRTLNFLEITVHGYDSDEFKQNFRMNRTTCYHLIKKVEQDKILPTHSFGRKKVSAEKAVLMTVWYLSNTETFRQISDRFNVTKSSSHRIIERIVKYLVKNSSMYIKWPDARRKEVIHKAFKNMKGIDGIMGAIDGSHINIKRPKENDHVYCNRKSEHSILLQGVCDHQKRFIDVFCGEAGSLHDSRVLKRSSLYEKCYNGFLGNDFLFGDSAYPCLNWLIPPFRDHGNLTRNQKIFNYRHSATRIVIENAFGLLKGRFRRLNVQCCVAAAVLHNSCLDLNDEINYKSEQTDNGNESEETVHNLSGMTPNDFRRDEIMRKMFGN